MISPIKSWLWDVADEVLGRIFLVLVLVPVCFVCDVRDWWLDRNY